MDRTSSAVLAVIPARGGSKRIPRKNIRPLAGKPLIQWTIEAAQQATKLTDWVVSTEDQEIAKIAADLGAHVIKRPIELAQDDTTSAAVCLHALDWMGNYDCCVLLHPTSPIRDPRDIDCAIDMLATAQAVASVSCRKRTYTHNASIYAFHVDWLRKTQNHYSDESVPLLMDAAHSVDIDTEADWALAEHYLCSLTATKC